MGRRPPAVSRFFSPPGSVASVLHANVLIGLGWTVLIVAAAAFGLLGGVLIVTGLPGESVS